MNTAADGTATAPHSRLEHLPVSFFASTMGLAGFTIASFKAAPALRLPAAISDALAVLTVAAFALLAVFYFGKVLLHPRAVAAEFNHPVKLHFFPTVSISLILISVVALHYSTAWAHTLFLIAAPLHLAFTVAVLHYWFNREHFQIVHLNPAWFIPIVGNVLVPIPGVSVGFFELSWFYFSIGIVFWIVLFAIITNRVLFHNPLPERLAPTLFILIAPPAVGFLAYERLSGALDPMARILYYFALFMTLFLMTQMPRLLRLRFFLSWWAYSFPLAAVTVATWVMHERTQHAVFSYLALGLTAVLTVVIAFLAVRTLAAIWRGQLCVPE